MIAGMVTPVTGPVFICPWWPSRSTADVVYTLSPRHSQDGAAWLDAARRGKRDLAGCSRACDRKRCYACGLSSSSAVMLVHAAEMVLFGVSHLLSKTPLLSST